MDKRESLIQRATVAGCCVRDCDAPVIRMDGVFNSVTLSVFVTVSTMSWTVQLDGRRKLITQNDKGWCRYPWFKTISEMVDL